MNPPPIPDLPPMQSAQAAAPPAPPQAAPVAPARQTQAVGSRRLRQLVGYVGGASLGFVLLVCTGELALRDELKPTALLATIEAKTDLGIMNIKMGAKPGEMVMTEADYRAKLAEAERNGQAKAELAFQEKLAVVQADKERVVGAYQTLYQRANIIAQAAIQLESLAQQFRQQLLAMSSGGRSVVIGMKDLFCGLGSPEACASAQEDRRSMIAEADELSRGDVGNRVRELMSGIDDPATLIAREDRQRNGTPALDR